jgi:uncharacterized protein (TIGR02757 family)
LRQTDTETLYTRFEDLYGRANHHRFIYPDPLHFVYCYETKQDRELAGFIASSLAFGRVSQINKTLQNLFRRIGRPTHYLKSRRLSSMRSDFVDFRHRFAKDVDVMVLLVALKRTIQTYGSLSSCFERGGESADVTLYPALAAFVQRMKEFMEGRSTFLLPDPGKGSALKRLNLFLRWMIRHDRVDPGVWKGLPKAKLIIPLDTHMYRACLNVGFTQRKQPNLRTALEVTECFRCINPEDPVKYDFALTRMGMGLN